MLSLLFQQIQQTLELYIYEIHDLLHEQLELQMVAHYLHESLKYTLYLIRRIYMSVPTLGPTLYMLKLTTNYGYQPN